MPPIQKVYNFDDRKFTILEGTRNDEYHNIQDDETSYFNNFFQTSPCVGQLVDNFGSESVNFHNIFNNENCMPKCQLKEETDGSLSEQCE